MMGTIDRSGAGAAREENEGSTVQSREQIRLTSLASCAG
jgi:hypothetical protein